MSVSAVRDQLAQRGSASLSELCALTNMPTGLVQGALELLVRKGQVTCHRDLPAAMDCGACSRAGKPGSCCSGPGQSKPGLVQPLIWYSWNASAAS